MPETESAQGGFHADVTLRGSLGEDRRTMRVDLFATHTWVSRATAERLGARTLSAIQAETPSGGTVERTLGELEIEIAGRKATVPVVFGESDDLEAIGRTTLAVLLLEPDLSSSSVSPRPWTHVTHPPLDLEKQDRALSERMKKGKTEDALAALREQGVFIPAIRYPTVARGQARLRLTVSAAHSAADVNQLVAALCGLNREG